MDIRIPGVFPTELWDIVFSQLWLFELENLNLTCKSFSHLVQEQLMLHRNIRRECLKLESDSELVPEDEFLVPWFRPLVKILKNPVAAYYTIELDTSLEQENDYQAPGRLKELCEASGPKSLAMLEDMDLVRLEADECAKRWFDPADWEEFMGDIEKLDQSALLVVLCCHLPNIRKLTLTPACWGGMEEAPWVQRLVSQLHKDIRKQPQRNPLDRPFAKVEHIEGLDFNGYYGLDLETIAGFIALPSVCWLETVQNHEMGFDWPEHLPRSNLREILLHSSSVPEEAIRKFASQALRGPCLIQHRWAYRRHDHTPEETWNTLLVPWENADTADHVVAFKPDDGEQFDSPYHPPMLRWQIKGNKQDDK